jgi:hypothetical protein
MAPRKIKYYFNEAEWEDLKNKHKGLWQIFNLMIECGYASEWNLKKQGALISRALSLVPSVDGSVDSEFSDLFAETLSDLKNEVAEYRTARECLDAEYQAKTRDIPEREERVTRRERQVSRDSVRLRDYEASLETKRIKLDKYETQLELKKKELELYEKKLNEIESPELRDRVRLKNEFLATVERFKDQWTNKAIVWSIGAILSGTQVPSFKGDK